MRKKLLVLPLIVTTSFAVASGFMPSENEAANAAYLNDPQQVGYQKECGGCHLAYPPVFLPSASWKSMMNGLKDHFGDNAELAPAPAAEISAFLDRYAADRVEGKYAERTRRATQGKAPGLRISETDYFRGKHHEISDTLVKGNPQVVSYSRCEACHIRANAGSYDEHEVRIPGHGKFED